jgi:uncharacterized protein YndB with AHSA1/START domain
MSDNISMSDIIPASPERVYAAWLDPEQHALMTGAAASDEGGGRFTAWDGYITGRTVSAVPHEKIVQAWRTTEFPPDAPDSMLTITFTAAEGGATRIGLLQETIPEGQAAAYKKGWDEHYFGPMKSWFARTSTLGKAKEAFEEVLEDAKEAAEQTVKEVKKAQKKAAATIKKVSAQVSKKVQSLLKKKKPAKKKVVKTVKKRAAPAKKKKKSLPKKKKK